MSKRKESWVVLEGRCAGPLVCPLSRIKTGSVVCIKQLSASPEITSRLREMGLCEDQKVKLLSSHSSVICQVCNARLGISKRLAECILVETLPAQMKVA
jgi:Fe2+ transport system protein FeoA